MVSQYVAIVATIVSFCMICFQLLLAGGLPFGRAAWGGQHVVLPLKLRLGSLAAAGIIGISAWTILARAGLVYPGAASMPVRTAVWFFAGFLVLNTMGNMASKSSVERQVMTPVTVVLAVCFFLVALS